MNATIEVQVLAKKIQTLDTKVVDRLVGDIAKKSKKKRLVSGQMFYSDFCAKIAESLNKQSTRELILAYKLHE